MSLIIQIYEGINSELFLESDLNRGHFNSDRDFFLSLIKKVEKEPTNLLSLLIQANKLLQMFQDFHFFSAVLEDFISMGKTTQFQR